MVVMRNISVAVFVIMLAGVCAAALTACSDDDGVVLETHAAPLSVPDSGSEAGR